MALDGKLTQDERDRFDREMEGNLEGSKTTVEVLLAIIDDTPEARAKFRAWLGEAEAFTKEMEETEWLA